MKTFESFESNRWIWRINLALQIVLVFALAAIVNYVGMRFYYRYDLTRNRAFSLAPETIAYVRQLPVPVTIIVTLASDEDDPDLDQAYRDVRGILREFEYASRDNPRGSVAVEFLNIYQRRARAEALGISEPNVVVFQSGTRKRTIFLDELYGTRDRQRSQFNGEKVFTSALLDVSSRERPVLYFLTGHGEMPLDEVSPLRGASQLETQLASRNYDSRTLDLAATREIPEDAAMVVVLSPQTPVLGAEQQLLRDYLSARAGRMIVTLDPGRQHGMDDLLFDWGMLADDVLVVEADPRFKDPGGDLLIQRYAPHPVTQSLADFQLRVVMGVARSVRADLGRPVDDALVVTDLLFTSDSSWGEVNYRATDRAQFDAARDLRGPIRVGAVAERKVDARLRINVRGGRLIVFGNSDFISNDRIAAGANLTLFLNAVSWSIDRDSQLHIPVRPVERLRLIISQEQLAITRVAIPFGPTLLVALIGVAVFLSRRR